MHACMHACVCLLARKTQRHLMRMLVGNMLAFAFIFLRLSPTSHRVSLSLSSRDARPPASLRKQTCPSLSLPALAIVDDCASCGDTSEEDRQMLQPPCAAAGEADRLCV